MTMRNVTQQLVGDLASGRDLAFCRLVETRGSTPQKAGALMLVYPDGSQAGTLGGGCVEAEVKRRALAVVTRGVAEVAKFQLDSDYGWDDGLICGGRMQVLIEPLGPGIPDNYFRQLGQLIEHGAGLTEAIVFDPQASGLAAPASFLFDEQDQLVSTRHAQVNDNLPPILIRENLKPLLTRPRPYGTKGVAFLPMLPRCRLIIVGGGHVGQAVAELAANVEFDVWVVDDRAEYVKAERFPAAEKRIAGTIDEVLPNIDVTADTYCLIVTRGHNHDQDALYHLVDRGARYVGLIGSRRKIKLIFDNLLDEGVAAAALARVYAPLGVHIGSQTVPEIALSICAELVSHRNRAGVVPGRPESVAVESVGSDAHA